MLKNMASEKGDELRKPNVEMNFKKLEHFAKKSSDQLKNPFPIFSQWKKANLKT